jgi:hypothetical protein
MILFSTVSGRNVAAQTDTTMPSPLSMPEEYINYTITRVNGSLWAKIDGTYPIHYSGPNEALPMVYPTPPGTTNIRLWLDEVELSWSNYLGDKHHTGIGDWQMILSVLEAVPSYFVLKIHYEHPVQVINGSYMFLYDLNIKDYLSTLSPKSTAYFTIMMDINFTDLNINTVSGGDERLSPINYSVTSADPAEITLKLVSEYDKPLLGDLLFSFKELGTEEPADRNVPVDFAVIAVVGLAVAALAGYILLKRSRKKNNVIQV